MADLSETITPNSSQLNADDLITGPRTITITGVRILKDEQPVAISFEGDNGKPYKPGLSMRRVLVMLWGKDQTAYVGRQLTLKRDPEVMFGKDKVGGIRISHMSHIDRDRSLPLTTTRGQRKPYEVKRLEVAPAPAEPTTPAQPAARDPQATADMLIGRLEKATTGEELQKAIPPGSKAEAALTWLDEEHPTQADRVRAAILAAEDRVGLVPLPPGFLGEPMPDEGAPE